MDFFESTATEYAADRLAGAAKLWLFLDYDGTLAEFAPTPDHVLPDPDLIGILAKLAAAARIQTAIVSGRRLEHIRRLIPVPGIILAGTYGVEVQSPDGETINRLDYGKIRPSLNQIKPNWERLILNREGFYLEDKGWSLAIHARYAAEIESDRILETARKAAARIMEPATFRLLGGHRFLEISPLLANKGRAVEYLLEKYPFPGALPVYAGDDDKDEEAFELIKQEGGVSILVAKEVRRSKADLQIRSTDAVREWLKTIAN